MIHVGVLTYNVISSLRDELMQRTLDSIEAAFPDASWTLFDNGSTDGSNLGLDTDGWTFAQYTDNERRTPGAGRNRLMRHIAAEPDDIIVLSDDDMLWRAGAGWMLRDFWNASPDVTLVGGLLEPEYPWSRPVGPFEAGGLRGIVRPSVPAAAWSFRARDWALIGPLKETGDGEGEDIDACKRLTAAGRVIVALDLAEHLGDGYSQLGNDEARRITGRAIDREKWKL